MDGLTLQKQVVVSRALQIGLRFSPDSKLLALASDSNAILLYDINAEQLSIPPLSGATAYIYNIAFRPDGRVIAVMDGYSQLWLWDTTRGLPIGLPTQAHYIGYDAAYTADGQHLITVGSDPVISEWDFRPEEVIQSLCNTVGRELTPQEWALYVSVTEPYRSVCTE
jgi:WD40 repeat protein